MSLYLKHQFMHLIRVWNIRYTYQMIKIFPPAKSNYALIISEYD